MMPPTAPAPGDPIGDVPAPPARPACGCADADAAGAMPPPNGDGVVDAPPPRPPVEPVAPVAPGVDDPGIAWPARIGWKSSLVMGSLYFLRRNRCSTSTSRLGGAALAY